MKLTQASNNNNSSSMKNGHDVTDRSYFASSSSTTTTRVFSSYREPSPGSDSGSSSAGSGNLVQKQIERIYGGRVQSIRHVIQWNCCSFSLDNCLHLVVLCLDLQRTIIVGSLGSDSLGTPTKT